MVPGPWHEAVVTVWDRPAVMDRLGGDPDLLAEIVDLLLEDLPPRVAELLRTEPPEATRKLAHGLKGALANVGGDAAAAAMFALERAAIEGRLADLPPLRERANLAWRELEHTLRTWRQA